MLINPAKAISHCTLTTINTRPFERLFILKTIDALPFDRFHNNLCQQSAFNWQGYNWNYVFMRRL